MALPATVTYDGQTWQRIDKRDRDVLWDGTEFLGGLEWEPASEAPPVPYRMGSVGIGRTMRGGVLQGEAITDYDAIMWAPSQAPDNTILVVIDITDRPDWDDLGTTRVFTDDPMDQQTGVLWSADPLTGNADLAGELVPSAGPLTYFPVEVIPSGPFTVGYIVIGSVFELDAGADVNGYLSEVRHGIYFPAVVPVVPVARVTATQVTAGVVRRS